MSPIHRMKTRHSNLSDKQNFIYDDSTRFNNLQKSTTILDQLNALERTNLQLQQDLEQRDGTIRLMEERQASLLQEKANLEKVLNEVDEVGKHSEFEEMQERLKTRFEDNLRKETEELRMQIGELEHALLSKKMELQSATSDNEKLRKESQDKAEKIRHFEDNYVTRLKYEKKLGELNKLKTEVPTLKDTITLREMKIGELEAKVVQIEENRRREVDQLKKKSDEKYEDARRKWDERHKKLKDQVGELNKWKSQHLMGETVDVAQV